MKVKICFQNEIHKISKHPAAFQDFLKHVRTIFHTQLPENWALQYIDSDGDKILISDQKEYEVFVNDESKNGSAVTKVFVVPIEQALETVEEKSLENEKKGDQDYQTIQIEEKKIEESIDKVGNIEEIKALENPKENGEHIQNKDLVEFKDIKNPEQVTLEKKEEELKETKEEEKEFVFSLNGHKHIEDSQAQNFAQGNVTKPFENKAEVDLEALSQLLSSMISKNLPETIKKHFDDQSFSLSQSLIFSENKNNILNEEPKEASAPKATHYGVACKGCQMNPIVGIRYKCTICPNFDYCEKCEEASQHPHNFVKMRQRDLLDIFKPSKPVVNNSGNQRKEESRKLVDKKVDFAENSRKKEQKPVNIKEEEPSKDYFQVLKGKVKKLQKHFPKAHFEILCAYVNGAPQDMSMDELIANFKH